MAGMDWRLVRMKQPVEELMTQPFYIGLEAKKQQLLLLKAINSEEETFLEFQLNADGQKDAA
jgi:hypothetical protein